MPLPHFSKFSNVSCFAAHTHRGTIILKYCYNPFTSFVILQDESTKSYKEHVYFVVPFSHLFHSFQWLGETKQIFQLLILNCKNESERGDLCQVEDDFKEEEASHWLEISNSIKAQSPFEKLYLNLFKRIHGEKRRKTLSSIL